MLMNDLINLAACIPSTGSTDPLCKAWLRVLSPNPLYSLTTRRVPWWHSPHPQPSSPGLQGTGLQCPWNCRPPSNHKPGSWLISTLITLDKDTEDQRILMIDPNSKELQHAYLADPQSPALSPSSTDFSRLFCQQFAKALFIPYLIQSPSQPCGIDALTAGLPKILDKLVKNVYIRIKVQE